jgi:hypothetical protein
MRSLRLLAAPLAAALLSAPALCGNGAPEPGSLLLFPFFESGQGTLTAITVTNTNSDFAPAPGGLYAGTVDVEFVYVNGDPLGGIFYCQEFNTTRRLTPNDSITVASSLDNTSFLRGYVYAFAKSPTSGQAIAWNALTGSAFQLLPGDSYSINPFVFRSGRALSEGQATDLNGNGMRDLNGAEYERVADRVVVPHFWGDAPGTPQYLVLINLTGASQFQAVVNLLVYNDNEEVFSASHAFRCWTKRRLAEVNGAFTEQFLDGTNNAATESVQGHESGWYRLNGGVAFSSSDSVEDPAILAAQISGYGGELCAQQPFVSGLNPTHGELISYSPFHD